MYPGSGGHVMQREVGTGLLGCLTGELRCCFVGSTKSAKALRRDVCGMLTILGEALCSWGLEGDCRWDKCGSKELGAFDELSPVSILIFPALYLCT